MYFETLKPFDIISAPYIDLDGNVKAFTNGRKQNGLFLVLAIDKGNVIGCKITSQSTFHNTPDFTYTLNVESHPFLKATSYIQLTKPHTLNYYACQKIGEVAAFCRPGIFKQFRLFADTLSKILSTEMPVQKYTSPNVTPRTFGGVVIKK